MHKRRMSFILAGIMFGLVACAQEQPPAATEEILEIVTEEAVATEAATATPFIVRTLPPTWTPSPVPEGGNISTDGSAEATPPAAAEENPAPEIIPPTALVVCDTFGEDRELNRRTFTPGAPVQVFWTRVEGAASYFVTLIDQNGNTVQTDYTTEPTLVYPPEIFEPNTLYGWEAYPIDPAGRQMCVSRGAELLPDNRPGG